MAFAAQFAREKVRHAVILAREQLAPFVGRKRGAEGALHGVERVEIVRRLSGDDIIPLGIINENVHRGGGAVDIPLDRFPDIADIAGGKFIVVLRVTGIAQVAPGIGKGKCGVEDVQLPVHFLGDGGNDHLVRGGNLLLDRFRHVQGAVGKAGQRNEQNQQIRRRPAKDNRFRSVFQAAHAVRFPLFSRCVSIVLL